MERADEQIGDVVDVVFNIEGAITHLILDLNDVEGVEAGRYLVPVGAVRFIVQVQKETRMLCTVGIILVALSPSRRE